MASKNELQDILKSKHNINKGISDPLNLEECERLLDVLEIEIGTAKLVQSFAQKNSELSGRSRSLGLRRSNAESKLESVQAEYRELEDSIRQIEASKTTLENKKRQLDQEKQDLESQIQTLSSENLSLATRVDALAANNNELLEANDRLKKDNKSLKNIVDAIRLRLARDTNELLKYEDNELRKALIRLFKWTLG
jgi:chromosome segregation ATPase